MSGLPPAEQDMTSIVLLGAFNPRIFQPAWFAAQGLLSSDSVEDVNVELINNDYCAFETDWFRLEVLSNRLVLRSTSTPVVEMLRDLLLGTMVTLRHTPVTRLGLNTHGHFPLGTTDAWHSFGHKLAPKTELWDPIVNSPGTLTLTVQGERTDGFAGHVHVKIEPSTIIEAGVFIETNDEFRELESTSSSWVAAVIEQEWENSRARAVEIRTHLYNVATNAGTA